MNKEKLKNLIYWNYIWCVSNLEQLVAFEIFWTLFEVSFIFRGIRGSSENLL